MSPTASSDQIKTAYKRQSLKCHPDRIAVGSPGYEQTRKQATEQFQAVADAFYTLSDPGQLLLEWATNDVVGSAADTHNLHTKQVGGPRTIA